MGKRIISYFSKGEICLWGTSVFLTVAAFCIFDRSNVLSLIASVIGVTSLIFCAKGNPVGQLLMIVFSVLYGIISFSCSYYGEMITYLGMTAPMALLALISWLRNPYNGSKSEVKVARLKRKDIILMSLFTVIVTVAFYFILAFFNTANLIPSTVSVATSFVAVYLTFCRSPYYALAYASNDIVLIVLWVMATVKDTSYISVIVCFLMFLVNDLYGFYSWLKMEKRQNKKREA